MATEKSINDIITRVQNLLARAEDSATTAPEAALCRQHAERLMRQWRLDEENLLASDPSSLSPTSRDIFVAKAANEFLLERLSLLIAIAHHSQVMTHTDWKTAKVDDQLVHGMWVTLVGFEVDLRQTEWLWSSAILAFAQNLEPTRNDLLSEQENVYRMRSAGMLRKDVAVLMWGENTPALRTKAQRLYLRECANRGETPQLDGLGTDAKTFRASYARAFVDRVITRLRDARDAVDSAGGVIVLAGRAERVREALYQMFPQDRSSSTPAIVDYTPRKYRGPTKADLRRMQRQYYSPAARAGENEGERAANQVEIARTDTTRRIEE